MFVRSVDFTFLVSLFSLNFKGHHQCLVGHRGHSGVSFPSRVAGRPSRFETQPSDASFTVPSARYVIISFVAVSCFLVAVSERERIVADRSHKFPVSVSAVICSFKFRGPCVT